MSARRRLVIVTFLFYLFGVGFLADVVILHSDMYPQVPIETMLYLLITFKTVPYATLIMGGIAIISLWITYTYV